MNRTSSPRGPRAGRASRWLLGLAALLPLAAVPAEPATPPEPPAPPDAAALERQIDEARRKLDEAAAELAMLSKKLYVLDLEGDQSNKPMIGVLVGDKHRDGGVDIIGVTPEAGAAKAGLQAGDRLVAVNGQRLDGGGHPMHAFKEAMESVEPGDVVSVEWVRGDQTMRADVTTHARGTYLKKLDMDKTWDVDMDLSGLEELEKLKQLEELDKLDSLAELKHLKALKAGDVLELKMVEGDLAGYFGVEKGLVVMSAPEASELRAGDVILAVDGEPVGDADEVRSTLHDAEVAVTASVLRREQQTDVTVDPGWVVLEAPGVRGVRVMVDHREPGESSEP